MKYLDYSPLVDVSKQNDITTVVPENIYFAQRNAFKQVKNYICQQYADTDLPDSEKIYRWLHERLNINDDECLSDMWSPEQLDSIILAIYNIEKRLSGDNATDRNREFIVADDTGIGKGRILAAIARYGLSNDMNVLFFTESSYLFTDFYRDIVNTNTQQYLHGSLYLLHNNAKVYHPKTQEVVASSLGIKNNQSIILNKKFEYIKRNKPITFDTNFILSTYSQFNREKSANEKVEFLSWWTKNKLTIVIFDEFHNTVGDSTINMIKDKIISLPNVIPINSSATAIDNYQQLASLNKLLNITNRDKKVIEKLEFEDNVFLKNQIAFNLTNNAMLLRREHTSVRKIKYKDIDLEHKNSIEDLLSKYRQIIFMLFDCYMLVGQKFNLFEKKNFKNKWMQFGSTITRLAKVIVLLGKKDFIVQETLDAIKNNQKVVITLNSTFSSLIKLCIEYENKNNINPIISDESNKVTGNLLNNINFNTLLRHLVDHVLENIQLKHTKISPLNDNDVIDKYNEIIGLINTFPRLELSIIDEITTALNGYGINVLEISGRDNKLLKVSDNEYELVSFKPNEKEKPIVINKFNNTDPKADLTQRYDVIIITLAGSTGCSLHASRDFIDQRQRKMIEAEITPRVKKRLQFFGRVFRKNQLSEPEIVSVSSGTKFEQRTILLEENKLTNLRAFVGSDYELSSVSEDYYNGDMNYLAQLYLVHHPILAQKLGISFSQNKDPYYHIDMLLKRSILLDDLEQEDLFEYLEYGFNVYNKSLLTYNNNLKYKDVLINSVELLWHNMSSSELACYKQLDKREKIKTTLPAVSLVKASNKYILPCITVDDLKSVLERNTNKSEMLCQFLSHVNLKNIYGNHLSAVKDNLMKIKSLKIGSQISFNINGMTYFGYIEDIIVPSNPNLYQYITHYLFDIRLINANVLKTENRQQINYLSIMGSILLENDNFKIYEQPINFDKYVHNEETHYEQQMTFLMGNMFYVNYLKHLYHVGEFVNFYKELYTGYLEQLIALRLPAKFDIKNKLSQQRPIVSYDVLRRLINSSHIISAYDGKFILKPTNNIWEVSIHESLYQDEEIINDSVLVKLGKILSNKNDVLAFKIHGSRDCHQIMRELFFNPHIDFTYKL